ncbi:MAG: ABC transporter permease [Actinomycetaceae bacterium]|nr:ABC transporter permease [Actinomycetaceae bacterium]
MNPTLVAAQTLIRSRDRATFILTVFAFALPHAVFLTVIGGASAFFERSEYPQEYGQSAGTYVVLASIATVLLVVPILSMGAAAARLGLMRRSQDLAVMRLLGLSPMRAKAASVIETSRSALIGIGLGIVIYLVTLPLWQLVSFQQHHLTIAEMWMGIWLLLAACLVMMLLAIASSWMAMRKVAVTPLGVVRRSDARKISPIGAILTVIVFLVWLWVSPGLFASGEDIAALVLLAMMGIFFALLNALGTFGISLIGRAIVRLARTPSALLAGRRIMDDPRSLWRAYGSVGLVGFIVGILYPLGSIFTYAGPDMSKEEATFIADIGQGMIITLALTFVLAAISTAVSQVTRTIDGIAHTRALLLSGASQRFLNRARRTEVMLPLSLIVVSAVGIGLLFVSTVGTLRSTNAGSILVIGFCALGMTTVFVASEITRPVERRLLAETH